MFENLKRPWFFKKYVIWKQTQLILTTFPSECSSNGVSIYVCLQANKYVYWVNQWRLNIDGECMLNNIYCIPDEKDSRKHVYIV